MVRQTLNKIVRARKYIWVQICKILPNLAKNPPKLPFLKKHLNNDFQPTFPANKLKNSSQHIVLQQKNQPNSQKSPETKESSIKEDKSFLKIGF